MLPSINNIPLYCVNGFLCWCTWHLITTSIWPCAGVSCYASLEDGLSGFVLSSMIDSLKVQ